MEVFEMAEAAENQLDREGDNEEVLVHAKETRTILKTIWHRNHRWLGHVLTYTTVLFRCSVAA